MRSVKAAVLGVHASSWPVPGEGRVAAPKGDGMEPDPFVASVKPEARGEYLT